VRLYIELAKGRLQAGGEERLSAQRNLVFVLDKALRLLHPMMPFLTESIWRNLPLPEADRAESLMIAAWPEPASLEHFANDGAERSISLVQEAVTAIRAIRARYQIAPRERLAVVIKAPQAEKVVLEAEYDTIAGLAGLSDVTIGEDAAKPEHSAVAAAGNAEIYVPLEGLVDFEAEAARLRRDREKAAGDLQRVEKKLANPGYMAKAAADIVDKDRAKAAELTEALAFIDAQLAELA
jgi:valyl-tRNA synthetase